VSDFKAGDSDPNGMAFGLDAHSDSWLSPGQGIVVDQGNNGRDEIYSFSAESPEGEVLLHSDADGEGPLVGAKDITVGATSVYVADGGARQIFQLARNGSLTPVPTDKPIGSPSGIANDPVTGDLLVTDRSGKRLLRVNPETGTIGDLATGLAIGWGPANVDLTPDGTQLFLTDRGSAAIFTLTRTAEKTAYQRGRAHAEKGELDQSIAAFTEAIERDPKHALAYGDRGFVYAATGDQEKAQADWAEATRLDPGCPKQYYYRGRFFADKGRLDLAIGQYDKALQLDGSMAQAHAWRGNARAESGDPEGAIEDYSHLIKLTPDDPQTRLARARAYHQKRDYDKAMADLTKVIDLDPGNGEAYKARSEAYFQMDDFDNAVADYNQSVELRSEGKEYARLTGDALERACKHPLATGESALALRAARVWEVGDDDQFAWTNEANLGLISAKLGRWQSAEDPSNFLAFGLVHIRGRLQPGLQFNSRPDGSVLHSEWDVSLPPGTVLKMEWALTDRSVERTRDGLKFTVIACDDEGEEHVLLEQVLPPKDAEVYQEQWEFDYEVKKLRFVKDTLDNKTYDQLWCLPEIVFPERGGEAETGPLGRRAPGPSIPDP
jgi:tetratricopeptide (TPR) repeat protein